MRVNHIATTFHIHSYTYTQIDGYQKLEQINFEQEFIGGKIPQKFKKTGLRPVNLLKQIMKKSRVAQDFCKVC